jgi:hypothetical protein
LQLGNEKRYSSNKTKFSGTKKGWNKSCVLWIDCPNCNSDNSFSSCEDEGGAIEVVIVGFNRLLNNCLLDGLMLYLKDSATFLKCENVALSG